MKTVVVGGLLFIALGAGLFSLKQPQEPKRRARVALAGGIYTNEPPGIVGLYEEGEAGPRFTTCDTGDIYAVEGTEDTMGRLKLAYRSLRVQATDGVIAELYGVADDNKRKGIFDAQGIRSVHPRLDDECPAAKR